MRHTLRRLRILRRVAAARTCRHENHATHKRTVTQREGLRYVAANRESEDINLGESERTHEHGGVVGHCFDRVRSIPTCSGHASVVKEHHRSVLSESVCDGRIPMVHPTAKVLKEEKGDSRFLPKATVGEPDSVALDETSRSGDMSVAHV